MNGAPRLPSTTSKSSCAQQPRLSSGFLFRRLPGSYPQIHGRHGTCRKTPTIHTHTHTPLNFGLFIPNNYSLRRTSTGRLSGTGRRWSVEPDAIRASSLSLCLFLSGSVGGGTTTTTSACSREGEKKMDSVEGKATLQGCCRDVMRALRGGILVWSEQQLVEANARRSAFRCSACTNHKVARASSPARCLEDAVGVSHRRQRE